MSMLNTHLANVEATLLATSRIPASAGHSLHKGTPREAFISKFLSDHLAEDVAVGTGEVIDANSKPRESRRQFDIVIYKRRFPRIDFGGGINAFLVESVVATIEVKSILDKAGLVQAAGAANALKSLTGAPSGSGMMSGWQPPGPLSYVVAYDGPASMETVHGWWDDVHKTLGTERPGFASNPAARLGTASSVVDGIYVLGRGFCHFDNTPISFMTDELRSKHPDLSWVVADAERGALMMLFLQLTTAVAAVDMRNFVPHHYASGFRLDSAKIRLHK